MAATLLSIRRVVVAIAACWSVSIATGFSGFGEYQQGALAALAACAALFAQWVLDGLVSFNQSREAR